MILGRGQFGQITRLIIVQCGSREIGANHGETVCGLCGMDEKTAGHIKFDCEALTNKRYWIFGS